jgi:hypothetical protein
MTSLRDIGYDLPSAVADLVDNSIDAGATTVEIDVCRKAHHSFIRISDDGRGMTERTLDEAMRYGSRRSYGGRDLGKFGLGLKTASLSQCRCLTVATRTTTKGRLRIRRWDLDDVRERDAWELQRLVPSECPSYLVSPLESMAGTVILWEKLDRILAYSRPESEYVVRALEEMGESIAEHLSMVFHRFLSGETANKHRLRILLNGAPLEPWDPFARSETGTKSLPEQTLVLNDGGKSLTVTVWPYVLPSQVRFSSAEAHAAAAGPQKWNRQQGIYFYRADRMIQSGGWNRLRTMDEHSKLARIAVDLPADSDDLFQINVAKMRVVVPDELRPQLRALAAGVVTDAQDAYRRRLRVVLGGEAPSGVAFEFVDASGGTMADLWPLISEVLSRELRDHSELLERVLVALANTRSERTLSEVADAR